MLLKTTHIPETKIVGHQREMSFAQNETFLLWNGFIPVKNQIEDIKSNNLISLQLYPIDFSFDSNFNPTRKFSKWAAVEVNHFENLKEGFESMIIAAGEYAVFLYQGNPMNATPFFIKIFNEWLPQNQWKLDNSRPHFEFLGDKYKNNSDESEEEIWIPISR